MPPLRDRAEDIPALTGAFIHSLAPDYGKNVTGVRPRVMKALGSYAWPGNIRELRNTVEHALLLCDDAEIDLAHLPEEIRRTTTA
jgi:transcriptional regulator with PAS, ATPase and Fis domain